jgi:hypothetical protein
MSNEIEKISEEESINEMVEMPEEIIKPIITKPSKEIKGKFKRGDRVVLKKENNKQLVYTSGQVMFYDPNTKLYRVNGVCRIKGRLQRPDTVLPLTKNFAEDELEYEK